jgi:hypothetical protein
MITTQQDLTQDAVQRGYKPGAIVILLSGAVVQLTSWPWFEGTGDDQQAQIMARRYVGDPTTNRMIPYFQIMKHTGQEQALDEVSFAQAIEAETATGEVFVLRDGQEEEWRVSWRGGLIAATWRQRGPADAHLQLLKEGKAKPQYAKGCEPPPLYNRMGRSG